MRSVMMPRCVMFSNSRATVYSYQSGRVAVGILFQSFGCIMPNALHAAERVCTVQSDHLHCDWLPLCMERYSLIHGSRLTPDIMPTFAKSMNALPVSTLRPLWIASRIRIVLVGKNLLNPTGQNAAIGTCSPFAPAGMKFCAHSGTQPPPNTPILLLYRCGTRLFSSSSCCCAYALYARSRDWSILSKCQMKDGLRHMRSTPFLMSRVDQNGNGEITCNRSSARVRFQKSVMVKLRMVSPATFAPCITLSHSLRNVLYRYVPDFSRTSGGMAGTSDVGNCGRGVPARCAA